MVVGFFYERFKDNAVSYTKFAKSAPCTRSATLSRGARVLPTLRLKRSKRPKNIIGAYLQGHPTGCRTGNGDQLSSTQAEPGQAIKSAVAYFPSISCATSCPVALYIYLPRESCKNLNLREIKMKGKCNHGTP